LKGFRGQVYTVDMSDDIVNKKIEGIMKFFESLEEYYVAQFLEGKWENDSVEALRLFLECYAFKKVGANDPDIVSFTANFIRDFIGQKGLEELFRERKEFWNSFKEKYKKGINENSHPLNPNSSRNSRFIFLDVLKENEGGSIKIENIVILAKEALSNGNISEIHKKLCSIGAKIASFFLRDLTLVEKIELPETANKEPYLLQPVDRWVEHMAELIKLCELKDRHTRIEKRICNLALEHKINPEKTNAGMWYFWTQVMSEGQKENFLINSTEKEQKALICLVKFLTEPEQRQNDTLA